MECFEHFSYQFHFGVWNSTEHIAVGMDSAVRVFDIRKHLSHSFQYSQALVTHNELHPIQLSALELQYAERDVPQVVVWNARYCGPGRRHVAHTKLGLAVVLLSAPAARSMFPLHC